MTAVVVLELGGYLGASGIENAPEGLLRGRNGGREGTSARRVRVVPLVGRRVAP